MDTKKSKIQVHAFLDNKVNRIKRKFMKNFLLKASEFSFI